MWNVLGGQEVAFPGWPLSGLTVLDQVQGAVGFPLRRLAGLGAKDRLPCDPQPKGLPAARRPASQRGHRWQGWGPWPGRLERWLPSTGARSVQCHSLLLE